MNNLGRWRHAEGYLFCGTLRIAVEDFDTDPSQEFKNELFDWICETLNSQRELHEFERDKTEFKN